MPEEPNLESAIFDIIGGLEAEPEARPQWKLRLEKEVLVAQPGVGIISPLILLNALEKHVYANLSGSGLVPALDRIIKRTGRFMEQNIGGTSPKELWLNRSTIIHNMPEFAPPILHYRPFFVLEISAKVLMTDATNGKTYQRNNSRTVPGSVLIDVYDHAKAKEKIRNRAFWEKGTIVERVAHEGLGELVYLPFWVVGFKISPTYKCGDIFSPPGQISSQTWEHQATLDCCGTITYDAIQGFYMKIPDLDLGSVVKYSANLIQDTRGSSNTASTTRYEMTL